MDSQFEMKRILITGKTYPNPARTGIEVACVGGVTEEGNWIRLFPIPFRLLADDKQFKKYDEIEVMAKKARSDQRPESYQVDPDSISVVRSMSSGGNKWNEVREKLLPLVSASMCVIQEQRKITRVTLGAFQPTGQIKLTIEATETDWTPEQLQKLVNYGMFDKIPQSTLEKVPYKFVYHFNCGTSECNGHNISCIDWEMCQT